MGAFAIGMAFAWVFEGRKLFSPPVNEEAVVAGVMEGYEVEEYEERIIHVSKCQV